MSASSHAVTNGQPKQHNKPGKQTYPDDLAKLFKPKYAVIFILHNHQNEHHTVNDLKQSDIAQLTGINERTVRQFLNELYDEHKLSWDKAAPTGPNIIVSYTLLSDFRQELAPLFENKIV